MHVPRRSDATGQLDEQRVYHTGNVTGSEEAAAVSYRTPTLKGSLRFHAVMDGAEAPAGGTRNSSQGPPLGLLSMGYFLEHLLPGYPSSDDQGSRRRRRRRPQRRGPCRRAAPSEVFIAAFCHYTIEAIAGGVGALTQGQSSGPVINQR